MEGSMIERFKVRHMENLKRFFVEVINGQYMELPDTERVHWFSR